MTELETKIIDFFALTNKYYTFNELKKELKIKGEKEYTYFNKCINNLVESGKIYYDAKKGYHAYNKNLNFKFGILKFNNGKHFVITEDYEKIIVKSSDLNGALYLDKVIVDLLSYNGKFYTGKVKEVIKRNKSSFICKVSSDLKNDKILLPYNNLHALNIFIDDGSLDSVNIGDVCKVELKNNSNCSKHIGTIKEIIGHIKDDDIDYKVYAALNNLNISFSEKSMKEIDKIKANEKFIINDNNIINLTNLAFISISEETEDCIETAIYIEKSKNGYRLIVCTPAINKYINTNSQIFKEAINRCITRYTPYGNVNLFPDYITKELCSLKKGKNKYVKACDFEIDEKGQINNYNIYDAIINVFDNLNYNQAENYIEKNEIFKQLSMLKEISILNNSNNLKQYINSNITYPHFSKNEDNEVVTVELSNENEYKYIMQNIKMSANNIFATEYSWLPFIYNNYKNCNLSNVKHIIKILNGANFDIPIMQNINYKSVYNILDGLGNSIEDSIAKKLISEAIIADNEELMNQRNFSIGIDEICNFTSPVNRITDFLLHTIIDEINSLDYSESGMNELEEYLNELCVNVFEAQKVNNEINKNDENKLLLNYMYNHINERYNAHIIDINNENLIIQTDNQIKGFIEIKKLNNDIFNYNKRSGNVIGRHSKETYQIGDKIYVISREISKKTGAVYFELLGKQKSLSKKL